MHRSRIELNVCKRLYARQFGYGNLNATAFSKEVWDVEGRRCVRWIGGRALFRADDELFDLQRRARYHRRQQQPSRIGIDAFIVGRIDNETAVALRASGADLVTNAKDDPLLAAQGYLSSIFSAVAD